MQRIAFMPYNNSRLICLGLLLGFCQEAVSYLACNRTGSQKIAFARVKQNGARFLLITAFIDVMTR